MHRKGDSARIAARAAAVMCVLGLARLDWGNIFTMPTGDKSLSFVDVGDVGNKADTSNSTPGYGAVSYSYDIGEFDVTAAQYAEFLNAVAKKDPYGLYNTHMASSSIGYCGITRTGSSGSFVYSVIAGRENLPVNYVNWGNAARFANWLHNGQPTGTLTGTPSLDVGLTEGGSYNLNGATTASALIAITRATGADYVIPTENEWYKAAYYKGGGTNAGYWKYPTQSNTQPSNVESATGTDNANFYKTSYTDPTNFLTAVGTFADSPGTYGTFDEGGDVFQWTDTVSSSGTNRELRGGPYENGYSGYLNASSRDDDAPNTASSYYGFRIVDLAVPEPASLGLLAMGGVGLLWRRRK